MNEQTTDVNPGACVEHGIWTPVPTAAPTSLDDFALKLKDVDPGEDERIKASGVMTFHAVGCTGDYGDHEPQMAVARAMETQLGVLGSAGISNRPVSAASFLFHLGDVVYKAEKDGQTIEDDQIDDPDFDDQREMYNSQFYAPYTGYNRCIFAIPGNHDGKVSPHAKRSALPHFLANFCAGSREQSSDNATDHRPAMTQPYVYWRLDTPLAYIVGLYSNVANGGILDDPSRPHHHPQYDWLVAQLSELHRRSAHDAPHRAVILAVHYPPYSGAANFGQRSDPRLGSTNATHALPLGVVLQQAFEESGLRPDVVISAHAHLYQRLTYHHADGWEVPYLIAGSGGHAPVEDLWKECDGGRGASRPLPFEAVLPSGFSLPAGESAQVVAYNDRDFGFVRLTVTPASLTGEFFTADTGVPAPDDSFNLDLETHKVQ